MTDSSKESIDQMLTAIVGIEIEITKMITSIGQNSGQRDATVESEGQGLQALALASRYAMSGTAW